MKFRKGIVATILLAVFTVFMLVGCGERAAKKYTVTFDANGGVCATETIEAEEGDTIEAPAATRRNYKFLGWFRDDDTQWAFATDTVTEDITLTAKWEQKTVTYTVTYNADGGEGTYLPQTVFEGETIENEPAEPQKAHYIFDGWYAEGSETAWDFAKDVVNADITLKAHYTPETYTITIDWDGAFANETIEKKYGEQVEKPTKTREGYTLDHFVDEENEEVAFPFDAEDDITITAVWEGNRYSVTLDLAGGVFTGAEPSSLTAIFDQSLDLGKPVRAGYDFLGWANGDDIISDADGIVTKWNIADSAELTAKWEENEAFGTQYTVRFSPYNGSEAIPNGTVSYGQAFKLATPGTKEGYTFYGWYYKGLLPNDDSEGNPYYIRMTDETGASLHPWSWEEGGNLSALWIKDGIDPTADGDIRPIYTALEFIQIRGDGNLEASYYLQANIDLAAYDDFTPIGQSEADGFKGVLEGNGYGISNLKITSVSKHVGLFGYLLNAKIRNIALTGVDIDLTITHVSGSVYIGTIASSIYGETEIVNCSAEGSIAYHAQHDSTGTYVLIGGLVGSSYEFNYPARDMTGTRTKITNSYSNVTIEATKLTGKSTDFYLGGLVGQSPWSEIENCYALGNIRGVTVGSGDIYVGGLVGDATAAIIKNCYSASSIIASSASELWAGGITGSLLYRTYNTEIKEARAENVFYAGDMYVTPNELSLPDAVGRLFGESNVLKDDTTNANGYIKNAYFYADAQFLGSWRVEADTTTSEPEDSALTTSATLATLTSSATKLFGDAFTYEDGKLPAFGTPITLTQTTTTVTFETDGDPIEQLTGKNGIVAAPTKIPTRPDNEGRRYTFEGYYADVNRTIPFDFLQFLDENTTVYVKFNESIIYCDVTFNSDGGSDVATQHVQWGQTIDEPQEPTKTGSLFEGWFYTDDEGMEKEYNFSDPVKKDIELKAHWNDNPPGDPHTITLDAKDGALSGEQTVTVRKNDVFDLGTATKQGFQFLGWYYKKTLDGDAYEYVKITDQTGKASVGASVTDKTKWLYDEDMTVFAVYFRTVSDIRLTSIYDAENALPIYTVEELNAIRTTITDGEAHDYVLQNDLDLENAPWTPFSTNEDVPYSGYFLGNGFTISNITVVKGQYMSFFGCLGTSTKIDSLTLKTVTVSYERGAEDSSSIYLSAFAYENGSAAIIHCTVDGATITVTDGEGAAWGSSEHIEVGGLVAGDRDDTGRILYSGIKNATISVTSKVMGNLDIGGIFGGLMDSRDSKGAKFQHDFATNVNITTNTAGASRVYVGLFLSYAVSRDLLPSDIYVKGNISVTETTCADIEVGGLTARHQIDGKGSPVYTNCVVDATITITAQESAKIQTAAFIGYAYAKNSTGCYLPTLTKCVFAGSITTAGVEASTATAYIAGVGKYDKVSIDAYFLTDATINGQAFADDTFKEDIQSYSAVSADYAAIKALFQSLEGWTVSDDALPVLDIAKSE